MRGSIIASVLLFLLLANGRAGADRFATVQLSRSGVAWLSPGTFRMGSDDADIAFASALCQRYSQPGSLCDAATFHDEQPARLVQLGAFAIDRSEVTRQAYLRCATAGACAPSRVPEADARLRDPQHPAVLVTAAEAAAYCAWVGGRLPTEAEWERAARAGSPRRFPWGNQWNDRLANAAPHDPAAPDRDGYRYLAPVGAFPDGANTHGLVDMAGNVWELTADQYDAEAYAKAGAVEPTGPADGNLRSIRGGSHASPPHMLRAAQRATVRENEPRPDVGFRCAYSEAFRAAAHGPR
jgi:formylglycine-generating enzyme required for sulfatase activity